VNTGTGRIVSHAAYPEIRITNNMSLPNVTLKLETLDANTRGDGTIYIEDKARGIITIYTKEADGAVSINIANRLTGAVTTASGINATTYTPLANQRYAWAIGESSRTRETARWQERGWLGIIDLGTNNIPVPPVRQVLSLSLIPNSNYFYTASVGNTTINPPSDTSLSAPEAGSKVYTYSRDVVVTEATSWKQTYYNVRSSWYGKKTYTYQYERNVGRFTTHSHSISADRAIGIDFLFNQAGLVTVNGGSSSILVDGQILNDRGTTTLTTQRDITAAANLTSVIDLGQQVATAKISGKVVSLTAGGRIGTDRVALPVSVAQVSGARLDATTAGGQINIAQAAGDLPIGLVKSMNATTGNRGAVTISARDDIFAVNQVTNGSGGFAAAVIGSAITLQSERGSVGTASNVMNIDTGGVNAEDRLTVQALTAAHIREISGDLRVNRIDSGQTGDIFQPVGEVVIYVPTGSLMDSNDRSIVDTRAVEALLGGVWTDMQLTVETGALDKIEDAKTALRATKTREYQTYWRWRAVHTETEFAAVMAGNDAAFVIATPEQDGLRAFYAAQALILDPSLTDAEALAEAEAQLTVLRTARAEQFRNLNTRYRDATYGTVSGTAAANASVLVSWSGVSRTVQADATGAWSAAYTREELLGFNGLRDPGAPNVSTGSIGIFTLDSYNSAFVEALTQRESDRIVASIKVWTPEELLYGFGVGLLQPVTDTRTTIEDPNIVAGSLKIVARDNVGVTSGSALIDMSLPLTTDSRILLAAAERQDINFLSSAQLASKVNFDAASRTISRVSGAGNWNQTFAAGDILQVDGLSPNATEAKFYTVEMVTANSIVVSTVGAMQIAVSERDIDVKLSAVVLNPLGEQVSALVSFARTGASTGTITRSGGGSFAAFAVGDRLVASNLSPLVTGFSDDAIRPSANINTEATAFVINAISADGNVLTVSTTAPDGIIDESAIAVALRSVVSVRYIEVILRDDFNVDVIRNIGSGGSVINSGRVDVSAGLDVFLGSEKTMNLGRVDAGGAVRLRTSDGIYSLNSGTTESVIARGALLFEASEGGIGTQANRVWYDLTDATRDMTARAGRDIWLGETAGDMRVATVYSAGGDVDLWALSGSIIDSIAKDFVNIEASDIRLRASGSIGSDDNPFEIEARGNGDAAGRGWVTLIAGGDIVLYQEGDLHVRSIFAQGDVTLTAMLSILDAVDLSDPTNPYSANETTVSLPRADIYGNNITLRAVNGFIGLAGNDLEIDMARNAMGVLKTDSFLDTYIIQVSSNGVGQGNVYLDTVTTSLPAVQVSKIVFRETVTVDDVIELTIAGVPLFYTVREQDLRDGAGNAVAGNSLVARQNVATGLAALVNADAATFELLSASVDLALGATTLTARRAGVGVPGFAAVVRMQSATGGAELIAVEPNDPGRIAFITALDGSILNAAGRDAGGERVSNITGSGAYLVARHNIGEIANPIFTRIGSLQGRSTEGATYLANAGDLNVLAISGTVGMFAGGDVLITAASPITIANSVDAVGDIHYISNDSAAANADFIRVVSGVTIQSRQGSIRFDAADHFVLEQGATVDALRDVIINTDYDVMNTDDQRGGDVTISGSIRTRGVTENTAALGDPAVNVRTAGDLIIRTSQLGNDTVTIDGTLTIARDLRIDTFGGDDALIVRTNLSAANILIQLGQGNDLAEIDGDLVAFGLLDPIPTISVNEAASAKDQRHANQRGDIVIDFGTDLSAEDRFLLSGNLTATRDISIAKLPHTQHVAQARDFYVVRRGFGLNVQPQGFVQAITSSHTGAMTLSLGAGDGRATAAAGTFEGLRAGDQIRITQGSIVEERVVRSISDDGSTVDFVGAFTQTFVLNQSLTVRMDVKLTANARMMVGDRLVTVTSGGSILPGALNVAAIEDNGFRLVMSNDSTRLPTGIQQDAFDRFMSLRLDPAQPVLLAQGDLVRFAFDGRASIYTYTGATAQSIDLSSYTLSDVQNSPLNWRLSTPADLPANTGALIMQVSDGGSIVARRDLSIQSGGGADRVITTGGFEAGRNLTIETAKGNDTVQIAGSLSDGPGQPDYALRARSGSVTVDLGTSAATGTQVLDLGDGGIFAGVDIVIAAKGDADVTSSVNGDMIAGRDILVTSEGGHDVFAFLSLVDAGRNIYIQTGAGSDEVRITNTVDAATGNVTVDLGLGGTAGRQRFEVIDGDVIAGLDLTILATGTTATDILVQGGLLTAVAPDGNMVAGRNLLIQTGSGADTLRVTGSMRAGEALLPSAVNSLIVDMGMGIDTILIDRNVTTTTGLVRIDLGAGPSGASLLRESLRILGNVKAGTSVSLLKSGFGAALLDITGTITAGTFVELRTGSGDDEINLRSDVTAGTDIIVETSSGRDAVTLFKKATAQTGDIRFDLGLGPVD
jgi:hypothetical protein